MRGVPSAGVGLGAFDVAAGPGPEYAYDASAGWRLGPGRHPVCVHLYRVGMPPGLYASADDPLPDLAAARPDPTEQALKLPAAMDDLEGWLVATLRVAPLTGCSRRWRGPSGRPVNGSPPIWWYGRYAGCFPSNWPADDCR